jgi:uncharacterized membrane protein HdeD (DUF308 family)
MERSRKFDWGALILGVLFVIAAIFAFSDPGASVIAVVFLFGIAVILKGIFELTFRRRIKEYTDKNHTAMIIIGIIDIIIGIFILLNLQIGMIAVALLFAIWIILDSVFMLITSSYIKNYSTGRFWFTVITGIIGLLIGIILLFNPIGGVLSIAFIIGIYFMIAGIVYILEAFNA